MASNFPHIRVTTYDDPDPSLIFLDNRRSGSSSYNVIFDNSYFLIGRRNETVDMRLYISGGHSNASVREAVIQGFTPQHEMVFQWRAWDNYNIADIHLDNPRNKSIRFPHMNAIHIDHDGHILLSCRHLSEVTKINRFTGEIIWRLGGAHSDFDFVNDPLNGFHNQHAIRATDPNRYLLFDNGDLHNPSVSRGVEYELNTDPNVMSARIVWQYPDPTTQAKYSHYMGNTQRLPNGNTLINWAVGNLPKLTEVHPEGVSHFDITHGGDQIYAVQLRQNGIPLEQGERYTFAFDAWADAPRIIEAKIGQDDSAYTNYSRIGYSYVTPQRKRFSFSFTMQEPTDLNARVVFNTGLTAEDVYIDNVSVIKQ